MGRGEGVRNGVVAARSPAEWSEDLSEAESTIDYRGALATYRQEALDDLLSRWDHWAHPVHVGRGHASTSAGCGLYRTSRQYDDENGALDDAIEHRLMQGMQACVERLETQHRMAIHIEARNVRLGLQVWRSPRLPANEREAREVIDAARQRLIVLLLSDGLMD